MTQQELEKLLLGASTSQRGTTNDKIYSSEICMGCVFELQIIYM